MNSTSNPPPFGSDFSMKYIPAKDDMYSMETGDVFASYARRKFTNSEGEVTSHEIHSKHRSTEAPTAEEQINYLPELVNACTKVLSYQIATNTVVPEEANNELPQ